MMMQNKEVVVDLETMGTDSNSAITSIGAVCINTLAKKEDKLILSEFYVEIDLQSCIDIGLGINGRTVLFWLNQPKDVIKQTFGEEEGLPIKKALLRFKKWFKKASEETMPLWGNGSDFDNVILKNAFKACGVEEPWKFFQNRCYRTLKNMYPEVELKRKGTLHNALDDAKTEAIHLWKILKHIEATRNVKV